MKFSLFHIKLYILSLINILILFINLFVYYHFKLKIFFNFIQLKYMYNARKNDNFSCLKGRTYGVKPFNI